MNINNSLKLTSRVISLARLAILVRKKPYHVLAALVASWCLVFWVGSRFDTWRFNRQENKYLLTKQQLDAKIKELEHAGAERLGEANAIREERQKYAVEIAQLKQDLAGARNELRQRPTIVRQATIIDRSDGAPVDVDALRSELDRLCTEYAKLSGEGCQRIVRR